MMKKATGNDSKFFTTSLKGENHILREELRSPQRDRKRDAVKKVFLRSYPKPITVEVINL